MAHQISHLMSQLKVNFFPCKFQHINSIAAALFSIWKEIGKGLRRNPIEDGAISGFSGQKSVPE